MQLVAKVSPVRAATWTVRRAVSTSNDNRVAPSGNLLQDRQRFERRKADAKFEANFGELNLSLWDL